MRPAQTARLRRPTKAWSRRKQLNEPDEPSGLRVALDVARPGSPRRAAPLLAGVACPPADSQHPRHDSRGHTADLAQHPATRPHRLCMQLPLRRHTQMRPWHENAHVERCRRQQPVRRITAIHRSARHDSCSPAEGCPSRLQHCPAYHTYSHRGSCPTHFKNHFSSSVCLRRTDDVLLPEIHPRQQQQQCLGKVVAARLG